MSQLLEVMSCHGCKSAIEWFNFD